MKLADIINISSFVSKCYDLYPVQAVFLCFGTAKMQNKAEEIVMELSETLKY
jgi:hypothetical protein